MDGTTLVLTNIVPLFGLIYLAFVILDHTALSRKERNLFQLLWTLEMISLMSDNMELVMASQNTASNWRILFSAISYSLRPGMIYVLIRLVWNQKLSKTKEFLLVLPQVISVAAAFSAFFTDVVYTYSIDNAFIRGPLGMIQHVIVLIYLVILTYIVIRYQVLDRQIAYRVMFLSLGFIVLSMFFETCMDITGVGRTATVMCTVFFASALQTTKLHQNIHALQENRELKQAMIELRKNRSVMQMLGEDYVTVIYANLTDGTFEVQKSPDSCMYNNAVQYMETQPDLMKLIDWYARERIIAEERPDFMEQFSRENIMNVLKTGKGITARFDCVHDDICECMEFHLMPAGHSSGDTAVVIGLRNVDEQVQKEKAQMTMLKEALDAAKVATNAKAQFLSRMSHDIRTPLNGMIGLLHIDGKHSDDLNLINSNREKIMVCADHLLSLVNDVLDMSKLEDGKVQLSRETIYLPQLSDEIETIVAMQGLEKGVRMYYKTSDVLKVTHPYVIASPLHVRQVLLNLYSNAIKYTDPGGEIHTTVSQLGVKDNHVLIQIRIQDNGIGISEEFLPHIFEPFTQESTDARSVYQGTGLGMSIVKGLVDLMGGTIEVQSEVNVGTTFIVTVPFEISDASHMKQERKSDDEYSLEGMRILMAEDNRLNNEIARTILEEAGAQVDAVFDGAAAYQMFMSHPVHTYDIVLLDIMMPKMDGLHTAKAIRSCGRKDADVIPIVAMSANAFEEDRQSSLDAGMNAHLVKPLNMNEVISVIVGFVQKTHKMEM
ncbi:MAG: hybrid sensor histidine kinase/response regulator [Bulleidia sp.]